MPPSFQIATHHHIPELLDMMAAFNAIDHYPFDLEVCTQNLNEFINNDQLGRLWVICLGDDMVGYVVLSFGFSFEYKGRDAFIDELFIKAPYRNKGIGSQTMTFLDEQARELNIKAIHLEVEKHNAQGNKLYLKQGYKGNNRSLLTKRF